MLSRRVGVTAEDLPLSWQNSHPPSCSRHLLISCLLQSETDLSCGTTGSRGWLAARSTEAIPERPCKQIKTGRLEEAFAGRRELVDLLEPKKENKLHERVSFGGGSGGHPLGLQV